MMRDLPQYIVVAAVNSEVLMSGLVAIKRADEAKVRIKAYCGLPEYEFGVLERALLLLNMWSGDTHD